MSKIKVLAIVPDAFGTGYFRSFKPHQMLQDLYSSDFDVEIVKQTELKYKPEELCKFNIIHFSKSILGDKFDGNDVVIDGVSQLGEIKKLLATEKIWGFNNADVAQQLRDRQQEIIERPDHKTNRFWTKSRQLASLLRMQKVPLVEEKDTIPMYGFKTEQLFHYLKSNGVKLIVDFDDYWEVARDSQLSGRLDSFKYNEIAKKHLRLVDYVTTTTPIFAEEIKRFNKNVIVLPNSIDGQESQWTPKPTTSSRLRILWGGGSSHKDDLLLLEGLVERLTTAGLINKVQFVLAGFDLRGVDSPYKSCWYDYEKIFTNNYKSVSEEYKNWLHTFNQHVEYPNIENEPYRRIWSKPIANYGTIYNYGDVCLAPLENNRFNGNKSQLKVVEAGWHEKAIICSNVKPYTLDIKNVYQKGGELDLVNGNGFLANDEKDFFKYIKLLVDKPELVNVIGSNLGKLVHDKYSLTKSTEKRAEFYKNLVKE